MRMLSGNISERVSKMPMAMVLIPFAVGIFFANNLLLPLWLLIAVCIVSLIGTIRLTKWWQTLAIFTLLFSTGALLHTISYREDIPYNKPLDIHLQIEHSSVAREGYTSTEAKIMECEEQTIEGYKVVVWSDSLLHFNTGDRLHLTTTIRPFRAERKEYAQLMFYRGVVGAISLNHRATYEYIPAAHTSLHDLAVNRLRSTMEEGDARAVVLAMTTGERSELSSELRQNYSASGASHLLAVSGLHIGIVFMLINLLLFPFGLLRYGNVVRSLLAVTSIWLYVWLCGMSPSAVRAAIMFSMLQLSLSSLREYVSVNIIASTAFIMLALNTNLLFDISFQLSFIAVAAIILWAVPLYRLCATQYRVVNAILGVLLVGVASTIATMPLVAHTFSTISVVGILINPVVIALANIIILTGVISLALPSFAIVAKWAAIAQNSIVERSASLPYSHFDITISKGGACGIYLLFILATILLLSLPKRDKFVKIEE